MTNPLLRQDRLVRWLHPGAWWAWAMCLAIVASIASNPLVMCGVGTAALLVVVTRGAHAPWAASVRAMLTVAGVVILARVVLQTILGAPQGSHVLVRLPALQLPALLTGVRLGGPITRESAVLALVEGLRFASILVCIAAATTVASPSRLFKAMPARLADVSTLLIVATTLVPHLVMDFRRIASARRLRGRSHRGLGAVVASLVPVLDGALERSVQLAASMAGRGYGAFPTPTRHRAPEWRLIETCVALCGLGALTAATWSGRHLAFDAFASTWPSMDAAAVLTLAFACAPAFITPGTPSSVVPEAV